MATVRAKNTDPPKAWYCPFCSVERKRDQPLKTKGEGQDWQAWCPSCSYDYPMLDERLPLSDATHGRHRKLPLRQLHRDCDHCYRQKIERMKKSDDIHTRNAAGQFERSHS